MARKLLVVLVVAQREVIIKAGGVAHINLAILTNVRWIQNDLFAFEHTTVT